MSVRLVEPIREKLTHPGTPGGALSGLTFAVKDNIDVAGTETTSSNPAWSRTHPPVTRNAPVVEALLDAGATFIGKAVADELAFGIDGVNVHYGVPHNPAAPGHVPGGSSSGSASAVAAGLCDFALGTDTGGSIRVPASYCGLFGLRPTWAAVSVDGVVPLAPIFDTVGWLAPDVATMSRVTDVLLGGQHVDSGPRDDVALVPLTEAFDFAEAPIADALMAATRERFPGRVKQPRAVGVDLGGLSQVRAVLQQYETWQCLGDWVQKNMEFLGPVVRARFLASASVTRSEYDEACQRRESLRNSFQSALGEGEIFCLPATPTTAPRIGAEIADSLRQRILAMNAVAGIWGAPALSIPLTTFDGHPVGLCLVGPPGADRDLVSCAASVVSRNDPGTSETLDRAGEKTQDGVAR